MNGYSQIQKSWNFNLEKVDRLKLKKVMLKFICFRSEEPVVPNMDISTGHVVLVSISSSEGETHVKKSRILVGKFRLKL